MINFFMWLCEKTNHLIRAEYPEKSEGNYDYCEICGTLIKEKILTSERSIQTSDTTAAKSSQP